MNRLVDESIGILKLDKGEKLYLYTSASGLKGICEGREFWVTERRFLNDSMEFHVATDVFCEILENHMNNKVLCNEIKERVVAEVERLQTPGLSLDDEVAYDGDYIISMCEECDSPLMWSSYANYVGYCIQFDYEKLMALLKKDNKYLILDGEVVYDHNEQIRIIERKIEEEFFQCEKAYGYLRSWKDLDKMTNEYIEDWCFFIAVELIVLNMFFKLPCFKGEREYRFIFMAGHDGGRYESKDIQKQYFRLRDEVLIPYIKVPFESLESVEKVLVGSKNKSDIAVKGVQYLFRNLKHSVTVERSQIPLRY